MKISPLFYLCTFCPHWWYLKLCELKKIIQFKIGTCNCNIVFWWFWVQNLQQMQLGKKRWCHNKHVCSIWFILVSFNSCSPEGCHPPPPSLRSSSPPPRPVWCSWCGPAWRWPPPVWLSSWIVQTLSKIRPSGKQSFSACTDIFKRLRGTNIYVGVLCSTSKAQIMFISI